MKNRIPDEVFKEIFPRKLKRSKVSNLVYTQIKKMITSRELSRGQRLAEEKLAHSLNVSRTPVRLALRQLEEDKLIIRKPKKGITVA